MEIIKEVTAAQQRLVVFPDISLCLFLQTLQFKKIQVIARIVNPQTNIT